MIALAADMKVNPRKRSSSLDILPLDTFVVAGLVGLVGVGDTVVAVFVVVGISLVEEVESKRLESDVACMVVDTELPTRVCVCVEDELSPITPSV